MNSTKNKHLINTHTTATQKTHTTYSSHFSVPLFCVFLCFFGALTSFVRSNQISIDFRRIEIVKERKGEIKEGKYHSSITQVSINVRIEISSINYHISDQRWKR
ncbi:hypothetical protein Droror1_Dr00025774 [Drosera rotundifolia]